MATGSERYFVVGAYIPPSKTDASTIKCVTDAFTNRPKGCLPLLIGDLNVDLECPRDMKEAEIAASVEDLGLGCYTRHFVQRRRRHTRGSWTWQQKCTNRGTGIE